jgi:hypothetical protein
MEVHTRGPSRTSVSWLRDWERAHGGSPPRSAGSPTRQPGMVAMSPRERCKDRDLLVTRRAQILGEQGLVCFLEVRASRRHHAVHVRLRLGRRVDAADRQVLELSVDRRGNVGRRIRGAQVDLVAARRQRCRDRCRDRRPSHATLHHHHHQPAASRRDLVDEGRGRRWGSQRQRRGGPRERLQSLIVKEGTERGKAHHVERPQGDLDSGQTR